MYSSIGFDQESGGTTALNIPVKVVNINSDRKVTISALDALQMNVKVINVCLTLFSTEFGYNGDYRIIQQ